MLRRRLHRLQPADNRPETRHLFQHSRRAFYGLGGGAARRADHLSALVGEKRVKGSV